MLADRLQDIKAERFEVRCLRRSGLVRKFKARCGLGFSQFS